MGFEYDMIVIGGGAAGLTASGMSALLGAKTALVERRKLGGDCTWFGCVPSKTLLRAARAAHEIRTADRLGLAAAEPQFDFSKLMEHVRKTRSRIYEDADAPPHMERLGVEVVAGRARFFDPHTIEVEDESNRMRRLSSRFFILATGSRPKMPEFAERTLTNETIFELQSRPDRLVIMGAGPVGIEIAQAFTRLGSRVDVVTPGDRILARDDPKHAAMLQEYLRREGVVFHLGQKVTTLSRGAGGLTAALDDGNTLTCDAVLAAMGREPVVEELDLESAGVQVEEKGIMIDLHCRTSQRHIYAVGDVTGKYNFTHMAEHMSKVAVTNAILRWPANVDARHVVWSTFSDPELAHLGESEAELHKRKARYNEYRFSFDKLDRAITDAATKGEVKVFAGRAGRILGVSILGANAGEMISEYALAMRNGLRLSDIANTIHPYPTFLLANRKVADQHTARYLDSPFLALLGRILGYRGVRKGAAALIHQDRRDR
jgi:pyruvate/2-oxoglutarate dehydrogenase complex dihydrolipoamide dehydrogenase (E3) component